MITIIISIANKVKKRTLKVKPGQKKSGGGICRVCCSCFCCCGYSRSCFGDKKNVYKNKLAVAGPGGREKGDIEEGKVDGAVSITVFDVDGYDAEGFNVQGYSRDGYTRQDYIDAGYSLAVAVCVSY